MDHLRRVALISSGLAVVALTVAGCTSSSDGNDPAPVETVTPSASSAAPPTGSGVPATSPAAGGTASGGAESTSAASGPGLCTPTVMTFVVGPPDGAAGTTYFSVTATNGSATACVTTGFPGVAFLDGSGNQFLQAERDTTVAKTTLTVAPGGSVHTTIAAGDVGNGGQGCTASPAILLTLPDNTDSTKLTINDGSVCDARVQAFVSGSA